ncbi:MAG: hypothetical protein Q9225_007181 [Loekoesia sp. 1 TL-2023]
MTHEKIGHDLIALDQLNFRAKMSDDEQAKTIATISENVKVIWPVPKEKESIVPSTPEVIAAGLKPSSESLGARMAQESAISEQILGDPALVTNDRRQAYWQLHQELNTMSAQAPEYDEACL